MIPLPQITSLMFKQLVHENEKTYYTLCLVISVLTYLALIISIIGIFYILIGVAFTVFLHGISVAHIRSNGIKVTERQFPSLHARIKELAVKMGFTVVPEVYLVQSNGWLNAFATRFFGRNFIVLSSDLAEITIDGHMEELHFIIAHELIHIQRNHVMKNVWILPALWVPFLGNAYSRACEFTCDRMASVYIDNTVASVNALLMLAVGKRLFSSVHKEDYILTSKQETGFFIWLSEVLSQSPSASKENTGSRTSQRILE
jgi:Zn-dependent protease with chaperone function